MPPKIKVKFNDKDKQNLKEKENNVVTSTTPPASEKEDKPIDARSRRKSKKLRPGLAEILTSDEMDDNSFDEARTVQKNKWTDPEIVSPYFPEAPFNNPGKVRNNLAVFDADKNVSEGSTSEVEVPSAAVKRFDAGTVCQQKKDFAVEDIGGEGDLNQLEGGLCGFGVKVTPSTTVSPCLKSDGQKFATTDYATSAAIHFDFVPKLIHPINGHVSTFTSHREFTDFLRSSGCLRLFGTCILNVYRMKSWPPPENLLEQMLNSMGYQLAARKEVDDLANCKQALILKLKLLTKERCQLLEILDKYQDSAAKYELLDQDEILPPRPDNSPLNMEQMHETFKNVQFSAIAEAGRDNEGTELKVIVSKPAPVSDTLPIPYHDKRMLY